MVAEPAPSGIVAALEQLREGLQGWVREHRTATLAEHEQGVRALWRRLAGPLLAAVLTEALGLGQPSLERVRERCPGCQQGRRRHSWRPREVLSSWGVVRLRRPYHYCRPCRRGWCPSDQRLGLEPWQELSPELQHQLTLLGTLLPFGQAARVLDELSGVAVGKETVRARTEAVGSQVVAVAQQAAARVERSQQAAEALDPAAGELVVQADGVFVRYLDDWHEVRLGLVAGCRPGAEPELLAPSYLAQRASAADFGPPLLAEAARRGALEVVGWQQPPGTDPRLQLGPALAELRRVIVLGDGAHWIWTLAAEYFGQRTEIVDWYHASAHLGALAAALADAAPARAAWLEQATTLLWEQGATALLPQLRSLAAPSPQAAAELAREIGYFATNAARMDYPAFRAAGLPLGSGAVESAAKHVVQQRLKRAGMRWSFAGAQAVLALCARWASQLPLAPPRLLAA